VELQLLQGIGLTPREALEAATSRAAAALRLSDRGLVAPGRRGDLVLLREDPRRDVEALDSIEAVYAQGRLVPRADLIAAARRRHRPVATPGNRS
jgi:imidazolonepropionase-like amidohydrolase